MASSNSKVIVVGLCLFLLTVFLHFWKIGGIPPGFYWDESSIGYNAYCIATTGADEYGVKFPLFFRCFDNYHDPVMIYFLAPFVKVFGLEKGVVRFPSAFFYVLAAVAFAVLSWEYTKDWRVAVIGGFVFSVQPWGFPVSRSMMSGYSAMLFGMCLGWFSILKAFREGSKRWAVISAAGWAFAMYSHNIGRPMTALTLICFGLACGGLVIRRWRITLTFCATFVVSLVPLVIHSLKSTRSLTNRFNAIKVWRDDTELKSVIFQVTDRYLDYFSPYFLFFNGDVNRRHHTGVHGELYFFLIPFIVFGLWCVIRYFKQERFYRFLLLVLSVYPLAASLTIDRMHSTRCINGLIPWCLVAGIGAKHLGYRRYWPKRITCLVLLLGAIEISLYFADYFTEYRIRAREWYSATFVESLATAFELLEDQDKLYLSPSSFFRRTDSKFKPYAYAHILFFGQVDPMIYQSQGMPEAIQPYFGPPVEPGILLRCDTLIKKIPESPSGAYAYKPNTEAIPSGARLLRRIPYTETIHFEIYKIRDGY